MNNLTPDDIPVGVVGLGLMGSSIAVALLIAGHPVKAIAPLAEDNELGPLRIKEQLILCENSGLLQHPIEYYVGRIKVSENYSLLRNCRFVLECVVELIEVKKAVYNKIISNTGADCVIASNTSAIPISVLQQLVSHPERFMGVHWAEPAYMTRFLEITCGDQTALHRAEWVFSLAHYWDKEPTILRKDIRGFVTNRLMYAVYREALSLIKNGEATIEDTDKAFRYDAGSWMTLMGIFRRMDFMGLKDYAEIINNTFPKLNNDDKIPEIMQQMIDERARGTKTSGGFYDYTKEEAKKWEDNFALFNRDIYDLAAKYPSGIERP
ncbi:MAG: 3-hydroxyacyl-CoA dehydrogenase family protein [Segetibacter sp.]